MAERFLGFAEKWREKLHH